MTDKKPANDIRHFRRQLSIQDKLLNADLDLRQSILDARNQRLADRRKFPKNKLKNRLNLSSRFKTSRPTVRWTYDPQLSKGGYRFGKTTFGTGFKGQAEYNTLKEWKSVFRLQDAEAKLAEQLNKKNLEIAKKTNRLRNLNRSRYLMDTLAAGANEFPGQTLATMKDSAEARKHVTTNNAVKAARLGIGLTKTVKNLGAGVALNYLSDRYLSPLAEKGGEALAELMINRHLAGQKKK